MSIKEILKAGTAVLAQSASESPELDARVLICHVLSIPVSRLLAIWTEEASPELAGEFHRLCRLRASGSPIAYLTGRKEFFGRDFLVDSRVLIPRPDTEILVEAALSAARILHGAGIPRLEIIDCCTGSGCIGITLALELKAAGIPARVSCSDLSPRALDAARMNAEELDAGDLVKFVHSDLLEAFRDGKQAFHMICSNPPYLSSIEVDQGPSLTWGEPRMALDGGPEGLDPYLPLVTQANEILVPGGLVFMEIGSTQKERVLQFLADQGYSEVMCLQDLAGHDRVARGKKQ